MPKLLLLDEALERSQHPVCPRAVMQSDQWRIAVYRDYYASAYVFTAYVTEYTAGRATATFNIGSGTLAGLKALLRHQQLPFEGAVWRAIEE